MQLAIRGFNWNLEFLIMYLDNLNLAISTL